jgi:hypothetical protein
MLLLWSRALGSHRCWLLLFVGCWRRCRRWSVLLCVQCLESRGLSNHEKMLILVAQNLQLSFVPLPLEVESRASLNVALEVSQSLGCYSESMGNVSFGLQLKARKCGPKSNYNVS